MHAEVERALASTADHVAIVAGDGEAAVLASARPLAVGHATSSVCRWPAGLCSCVAPRPRPGTMRAEVAALLRSSACARPGSPTSPRRLDVADMDYVAALESAGFRLMDALVTYFTHPHREAPTPVREVGQRAPDGARATWTKCWRSPRRRIAGFRGRFHLDPHLPAERTREFYLEWARQCCAGRMADRVVVADNGQVAFTGGPAPGASSRRPRVGGITLWAGSLGACRRDQPGAYAGLIRSLAAANSRGRRGHRDADAEPQHRDRADLRRGRRSIRARRLHVPRVAGVTSQDAASL